MNPALVMAATPRLEIVIGAVASCVPAFLVIPARIRAEQHATGLQRGAKIAQHARQLLARNVKQRRVGKDAVEAVRGQIELQKVLLPDLAAAPVARHARRSVRRTFQTDGRVADVGEGLEVAPGSAAEIENAKRRRRRRCDQQRGNVLADVVIARAGPELFGASVVMFAREAGDSFEFLRGKVIYPD